jgi:hypothetical protein
MRTEPPDEFVLTGSLSTRKQVPLLDNDLLRRQWPQPTLFPQEYHAGRPSIERLRPQASRTPHRLLLDLDGGS